MLSYLYIVLWLTFDDSSFLVNDRKTRSMFSSNCQQVCKKSKKLNLKAHYKRQYTIRYIMCVCVCECAFMTERITCTWTRTVFFVFPLSHCLADDYTIYNYLYTNNMLCSLLSALISDTITNYQEDELMMDDKWVRSVIAIILKIQYKIQCKNKSSREYLYHWILGIGNSSTFH